MGRLLPAAEIASHNIKLQERGHIMVWMQTNLYKAGGLRKRSSQMIGQKS
jgi:hypothetical protein